MDYKFIERLKFELKPLGETAGRIVPYVREAVEKLPHVREMKRMIKAEHDALCRRAIESMTDPLPELVEEIFRAFAADPWFAHAKGSVKQLLGAMEERNATLRLKGNFLIRQLKPWIAMYARYGELLGARYVRTKGGTLIADLAGKSREAAIELATKDVEEPDYPMLMFGNRFTGTGWSDLGRVDKSRQYFGQLDGRTQIGIVPPQANVEDGMYLRFEVLGEVPVLGEDVILTGPSAFYAGKVDGKVKFWAEIEFTHHPGSVFKPVEGAPKRERKVVATGADLSEIPRCDTGEHEFKVSFRNSQNQLCEGIVRADFRDEVYTKLIPNGIRPAKVTQLDTDSA